MMLYGQSFAWYHYHLESESKNTSSCRHIFSKPLGLGPHQPEDLCFWTVSHSSLEQSFQRLPERFKVMYKEMHLNNERNEKQNRQTVKSTLNYWPGAMIFLKVGSSQPHTLFTGEHLQSMGIDGSGTLQGSMGHTLKCNQQASYWS